ncbi:MAG: hypothetical protein V7739_06350 [Motiliproteus sp.]
MDLTTTDSDLTNKRHCGYSVAFAFIDNAPTEAQLLIHELQPIGPLDERTSQIEKVHDAVIGVNAEAVAKG